MHACLVRAAGGVTDLRTVEAGDGLEDLALAFGAGGVHHEHRHLRHGWRSLCRTTFERVWLASHDECRRRRGVCCPA
jgi:hypothetical protein